MVVVLFGLIGGSSVFIQALHAANLVVLILTVFATQYYHIKYSKKDLLRTD